mmetsp:Transcript_89074/g.238523  ORF Transcript_89074/g.238523 Transcript_89074/m.238523 type:complete len:229 (-) Transcript_89074:2918-3604(-)
MSVPSWEQSASTIVAELLLPRCHSCNCTRQTLAPAPSCLETKRSSSGMSFRTCHLKRGICFLDLRMCWACGRTLRFLCTPSRDGKNARLQCSPVCVLLAMCSVEHGVLANAHHVQQAAFEDRLKLLVPLARRESILRKRGLRSAKTVLLAQLAPRTRTDCGGRRSQRSGGSPSLRRCLRTGWCSTSSWHAAPRAFVLVAISALKATTEFSAVRAKTATQDSAPISFMA